MTDGDLVTRDDNGYLPRTLGVLQHFLKLGSVIVDVVILSVAVG
jgi:hypothetical protein